MDRNAQLKEMFGQHNYGILDHLGTSDDDRSDFGSEGQRRAFLEREKARQFFTSPDEEKAYADITPEEVDAIIDDCFARKPLTGRIIYQWQSADGELKSVPLLLLRKYLWMHVEETESVLKQVDQVDGALDSDIAAISQVMHYLPGFYLRLEKPTELFNEDSHT